MAGAAKATTRATARTIFFMGYLLISGWLVLAVGVREILGHGGCGEGND